MVRVKLLYPDGENTYGLFDFPEDGEATVQISKIVYPAKDIAKTDVIAATNDPETLSKLLDLGFNARPTIRNVTITISTSGQLKERIQEAAENRGLNVSNFIEEVLTNHLDSIG